MGSREQLAAAIGGAVAGLLALAIVAVLVVRDSDDRPAAPPAQPATTTAASSQRAAAPVGTLPEEPEPGVVATVEVGGSPSAVAVGQGATWVVAEGRIVRIDRERNELVARIGAGEPLEGEPPCGIAVGASGVWVTTSSGAVSQVSPERNRLVGSPIPDLAAGCLALATGGVWVTSPERGAVVQLDPEAKTILTEVPLEQTPQGIAVGAGSLWVATESLSEGTGAVVRLRPATGEVRATIPLPEPAHHLVASGQGVWVADRAGDLWRIDPATNHREDEPLTIRERGISGLALGGGALWLSTPESTGFQGSVLRFDPATGEQIGDPITVGEGPGGIVFGAGSLWVTNTEEGTVSRIER